MIRMHLDNVIEHQIRSLQDINVKMLTIEDKHAVTSLDNNAQISTSSTDEGARRKFYYHSQGVNIQKCIYQDLFIIVFNIFNT